MGERLHEMWRGAVDFLRGPRGLSGRDASAGNEEGLTRPEVRTSRPESIPLDDPALRGAVEALQRIAAGAPGDDVPPHLLAKARLTALTTTYPSLSSPKTGAGKRDITDALRDNRAREAFGLPPIEPKTGAE